MKDLRPTLVLVGLGVVGLLLARKSRASSRATRATPAAFRVVPVKGAAIPVEGRRAYLYRRSETHLHRGIDLPAKRGTPATLLAFLADHSNRKAKQPELSQEDQDRLDVPKVHHHPFIGYALGLFYNPQHIRP